MFDFAQRPVNRRTVMAGAAGAGALLASRPGQAQIPVLGFTHGVASGEPGQNSILLWTRFVGVDDRTVLRVEIADQPDFAKIISHGEVSANSANDFCCKITLGRLEPGTIYYYRFSSPDHKQSPLGRTRTLPAGALDQYRVAVFSCSNKGFGWFNAYAHAAARDDLDLVVHVGDYIYEYQRGAYPTTAESVPGRVIAPEHELLHLDDYRQRYASYRTDHDLLELHRLNPWVAIWDDHEFANDAWLNGAQNHDPKTEGDWNDRRNAAKQAHLEWLPVSGKPYQRYDIGDLLTLITLDTRVEGRDLQLSMGSVLKGAPDPKAALVKFRDGPWADPKRTLMGTEQEKWAADQLKSSVKSGFKWQFVAQQLVMGPLMLPPAAAGWLKPNPDPRATALVRSGVLAGSIGLPVNMDSWDGYPAARKRFLASAQLAKANLVVVSGDSHNAWAFDLSQGGKPAGVEFAGQGVTSPGFESELGVDPKTAAAGLVGFNPSLKFCDTSQRGYLTVTFTPESARSDWVFLQTVLTPSQATTTGQSAVVKRGTNKMTLLS